MSNKNPNFDVFRRNLSRFENATKHSRGQLVENSQTSKVSYYRKLIEKRIKSISDSVTWSKEQRLLMEMSKYLVFLNKKDTNSNLSNERIKNISSINESTLHRFKSNRLSSNNFVFSYKDQVIIPLFNGLTDQGILDFYNKFKESL